MLVAQSSHFNNFDPESNKWFLLLVWYRTLVGATERCIILPDPVADSLFYPALPSEIQQNFDSISRKINTLLLSSNHSNVGVYFNYVYDQEMIYSNSFGNIDRNDPSLGPPKNDSIFCIASITKVFTDLMLFQLDFNNILSMNDPITKYKISQNFNPKYPPNCQSNVNVTFAMLGSHMAG